MSGLYAGGAKPGTIVVVRGVGGEDQPAQAIVQVEGQDGSLIANQDIIITRASFDQQVAFSTRPTIGGPEYLYVFGDKLSRITVSCILFQEGVCLPGDEEGSSANQTNGVLSLMRFYARNRLTPGEAPIVTLAYNGVTIQGFLIQSAIESQSTRGRQAHGGRLTLLGWVDHESVGEANTDAGGTQASAPPVGEPQLVSQGAADVGQVASSSGQSSVGDYQAAYSNGWELLPSGGS